MKALVNRQYNRFDNIGIENRVLPPLKSDEIKVKVYAASLNKSDLFLAKGKPFMIKLMYGFKKPKHIYPGSDFSGEVIAIGSDVTKFKLGDKVFGDLSSSGFGAFAEEVNVSSSKVWLVPKGYSYIEASSLPMPVGTALEALDKVRDIKGKKVLVYGGSGGVGRFLVQLALYFGADIDVVASQKHSDDLTKLGVSNVYDYKTSKFALPKKTYDVIFAVNGYQTMKSYANSLVKQGCCIVIGGNGKQLLASMIKGWFYKLFKKKAFMNVLAKTGQDTLIKLSNICTETKLDVQIGKIYSLNNAKDAYFDFENNQHKGKYVIKIN